MSFFQSMVAFYKQTDSCSNRLTDDVAYQNSDMSTFGERLRQCRKEMGWSQAETARRAGMSQPNLSELERGEYPSSTFTPKLASIFGVNALWLSDGTGPKNPTPEIRDGSPSYGARDRNENPAIRDLDAATGQIIIWDTPEDLPPDETRVWVDRYDYVCSAGGGILQWDIRQKRALPFTAEFFKAIGSRPSSCRLVEARGDSMEPYLFNRDMMMMDLDKTSVRDGNIYAICFEGESLVKQLFKQSGGLLTLHSYNPKYPDRLVQLTEETDFQVVGEIVYRSGAGQAAA